MKAKRGRTRFFYHQPSPIMVKPGMKLGEADDRFVNRQNSKRANDSAGLPTNNVVDRENYYQQAIILAFIPIYNTQSCSP